MNGYSHSAQWGTWEGFKKVSGSQWLDHPVWWGIWEDLREDLKKASGSELLCHSSWWRTLLLEILITNRIDGEEESVVKACCNGWAS